MRYHMTLLSRARETRASACRSLRRISNRVRSSLGRQAAIDYRPRIGDEAVVATRGDCLVNWSIDSLPRDSDATTPGYRRLRVTRKVDKYLPATNDKSHIRNCANWLRTVNTARSMAVAASNLWVGRLLAQLCHRSRKRAMTQWMITVLDVN